MVAKFCPFIKNMFFVYHEKCVKDFTSLTQFQHLEELDLFAGKFYTDKIDELLHVRGQNMTRWPGFCAQF